MDFLPLIIGVIVAIAVSASKGKKRQTGGAPAPHSENFPFPKDFAEMFDMESNEEKATESEPQYYAPVEQSSPGIEDIDAEQEGVAMTVAQFKARSDRKEQNRLAIKSDAPMEIDHLSGERQAIDFDMRKAVIYSEILKPKYNDNF